MGGKYVNQEKRKATWKRYHKRSKAKINAERRKKYLTTGFYKHLQRKYGLNKDTYEALLESQNNTCAITGLKPNEGDKLQVDHCHATGKVRGLLLKNINKALGVFKDNPDWLRNAADYIEKHR